MQRFWLKTEIVKLDQEFCVHQIHNIAEALVAKVIKTVPVRYHNLPCFQITSALLSFSEKKNPIIDLEPAHAWLNQYTITSYK